MPDPLERADPHVRTRVRDDGEHVLTLNAAEDRIARRRGARRVCDYPPRRAVVPGDLDPVRGGDVDGVAAGDDPVGHHVLPFGSQLAEFPVLPGASAVGRDAPAVPDRPVPDLTL